MNGTDTTKLDSGFFAPGDENLSFSVNTFTTGTYNYTSVHDTAGNRSAYSNTLTVIVDHDDPTAIITFDGDSLVRAGDVSTLATFTFSEPMDSVTVPKVDVTYPGAADSLNLQNQALTESGNGDDVGPMRYRLIVQG